MAKYTATPIPFFLNLGWKEGMSYFSEVAEMMQEEQSELRESTKSKPFDASAWQRWQ